MAPSIPEHEVEILPENSIPCQEPNASSEECGSNCPPLEFTLVNGNLSQTRSCSHKPKKRPAGVQRSSSNVSNFSRAHSDIFHSGRNNKAFSHCGSSASTLVLAQNSGSMPARSSYADMPTPPRTTSLIAHLLSAAGHSGNVVGKLTRSQTASPSSTMSSWTDRAGSGVGSGMGSGRSSLAGRHALPLDSSLCNKIHRQTSFEVSSSTSTLAPSETA